MKPTLLKKALILDPSSPYDKKTKDILIDNGQISKISDQIKSNSNYEVIKLPDLHVSPGWMDASVSFGEPGFEERETLQNGCLTAAKSGFTGIALNLETQPVGDNQSTVSFVLNTSASFGCDVFPIANLTKGGKGEALAELFDLQSAGAIAFGDYMSPIENDLLMKIAIQYAQNIDALLLSFPKNKSISGSGLVNESAQSIQLGLKSEPNLSETLQISRDLHLLEYTGGKLHFPTISTKESVDLIRTAKVKGLDVSCSVSVHHLYFDDRELLNFDSNTKVSPPLRTKEDRLALLEALKDGTIDFVVSDHRPMEIESKKVAYNEAAYGTLGLESAFEALNSIEEISLDLLLKKITIDPRNRLNLENPSIKEGSAANISLFNPNKESRVFDKNSILSSNTNSIFLGEKLKGSVYGSINKSCLNLK
jgi:dihydroorotase